MRSPPWLVPASLTVGLVVLGGCADAPTQPDALVPAGELEAALSIDARLPTFTALAGMALAAASGARADGVEAGAALNGAGGAVLRLHAARELALRADATVDEAEAARLRAAAYAAGMAPLAQLLDAAEVEQAQGALAFWLRVGDGLVGRAELPAAREALLDGRALLDRSRAAAVAGDDLAVIAALVAAAERLAVTTPRSVLRRLLPELEAELAARGRASSDTADLDRQRAERLLRGARHAETEGLYVLGLRRAYYARQLLRALTPDTE